jgi:hypothetical protein
MVRENNLNVVENCWQLFKAKSIAFQLKCKVPNPNIKLLQEEWPENTKFANYQSPA